ncbi:unnamed protein product [Coffea canephora]|uniref:Uncharacterized protein n=1 Tax=Coffea canephora TaxID=49390 RepID=A0A068UT30_COFCA|nr:unnamed protein product [Coffea canephora]
MLKEKSSAAYLRVEYVNKGQHPKVECERIFKGRECDLCVAVLSSSSALWNHRETCQFSRSNNGVLYRLMANLGVQDEFRLDNSRARVVALACKMVGGGSDGSLELDTAKYPPLMKTSKLSKSLKYLTKAYLGHDVQTGQQDPCEGCVTTMWL